MSTESNPPERRFEEALRDLKQVTEQMQDHALPLDKAVDLYRQGMELAKQCHAQLEAAKATVRLLQEEEGAFKEVDFAPMTAHYAQDAKNECKP